MTMSDQSQELSMRASAPDFQRFIRGRRGVILLLMLIIVGTGWLVLNGGAGEGANAFTAEKVLRQFLEAIKAGDFDSAHQMFTEEIRSQLSPAQMASDLRANTTLMNVITQYKDLQVCEWGLFLKNNTRYMTPQGLIHYSGGDIVFDGELRQDPDFAWRITLFSITNAEPKPWGACQ